MEHILQDTSKTVSGIKDLGSFVVGCCCVHCYCVRCCCVCFHHVCCPCIHCHRVCCCCVHWFCARCSCVHCLRRLFFFCYCCSPFYFLPTLQNAWHGGGGNFDSSVDCDFGVFVVLVPVAVVDLVALVAVQLMAVVVVELAAVESMMESGRGIIRMRRNWQWRNWWLCFPH